MKTRERMNLKECLDVVHDLAMGNMIDWDMATEDEALMAERDRQMEAIGRIVDYVRWGKGHMPQS